MADQPITQEQYDSLKADLVKAGATLKQLIDMLLKGTSIEELGDSPSVASIIQKMAPNLMRAAVDKDARAIVGKVPPLVKELHEKYGDEFDAHIEAEKAAELKKYIN